MMAVVMIAVLGWRLREDSLVASSGMDESFVRKGAAARLAPGECSICRGGGIYAIGIGMCCGFLWGYRCHSWSTVLWICVACAATVRKA